jgi:hypothetical protein
MQSEDTDVLSHVNKESIVRKFINWAFIYAAMLGWGGLATADELSSSIVPVGNVKFGESACQAEPDDASTCQACDCCDDCLGNWYDNTVFFAGVDTFKSIGDRLTNINGGTGSLTGSFGGVAGFNTGVALGDSNLRGQIGGSYGLYDPRGRLGIVPQATDVEQQAFLTTGVFKRGDIENCDRLSYGFVMDAVFAENWGINANSINLGQLRGIVGYALNERTEVGGFATAHLWDDQAAVTVAGAPGVRRTVRGANQFNTYVRRNTDYGASLMAYIGAFDQADIQAWQFGLNGEAPLSCHCTLYGNFNYAVPGASAGPNGSGEEQFSAQIGLAYYFGGKAVSRSVTGQRGLPLLDVANNGSFLITD